MSIEGRRWAQTHGRAHCRSIPGRWAVLVAVADHVGPDLTGCYASTATLADEACVSKRTAQRHLDALAEVGLIRLGDQSRVAHIRADRRPVVWDLGTGRQDDTPSIIHRSAGRQNDTPSESTGRHGDAPQAHGVTSATPRGDILTATGRQNDAQTKKEEPKKKNQSQSQHLSVSGADLSSAKLSETEPGDREREVSEWLAGLDREDLERIAYRLVPEHRETLAQDVKSAAKEQGVTFPTGHASIGDLSDGLLRRALVLTLLFLEGPDGIGVDAVGELIL